VLDGHPAPPRKGAQQPCTFGPMSIVAKWSPILATAELLLNFGAPSSRICGTGEANHFKFSVQIDIDRYY